MRIGIDARSLTNWRGFGVYLREMLSEVARQSQDPITLFVDSPSAVESWLARPLPETWRVVTLPPVGRSPFWRDEFSLPRFYRQHPVDVFWHPDNNVCWHGPTPTVVTWHDAMVEMFPQYFFGPGRHRQLKGRIAHWLKLQLVRHHVSRVITVSESSKRDLCRIADVPPEQVVVVPNGVHPRYRPRRDAGLQDRLAAFQLRPGYILYTGGLNPHKNVATLITAYARIKADPAAPPLPPLVLCGKLEDSDNPYIVTSARALQDQVRRQGLGGDVHFLGYVPPEKLVDLYNGAAMLTFPSLYEGFGLPPAEAMACGIPVITSRSSSLPEVVGEAALLIDPRDPGDLAVAICRVLSDESLARRLAVAGPVQAAGFRWESAARTTLEVLTLAASQGARPILSTSHQPISYS